MIYKKLAAQYIADIKSGKLASHSRLPSLRQFKLLHHISMTSALNCYQHLESLGWIISKPQSGYYVCPEFISQQQPDFIEFESKMSNPKYDDPQQSYTPIITTNGPLGYTRIDPAQLPLEQLQQSFRRALKRQSKNISLYPKPEGEKSLRNSLASHFGRYNFHFPSDRLIITNGCMDAIQTALEVTTEIGDTVAVSSPCYSGLLDMLNLLSRQVIEIPSTSQGIDLVQLENHMKDGSIQAGIFCTSHMNPQGTSMNAQQKQALVKLAEQYEIPIIEDDVYIEIAHEKTIPLPAKYWDKKGYVLWCGSVSKTLAPGYRLGWCLPGRYYQQYLKRRCLSFQGVNSPTQLAIADFISNGCYVTHLKKIRFKLQQYKLDYLHYLRKNLPATTKISEPAGGFVLWIQIPNLDTKKLFEEVITHNVDIRVGHHFTTLSLYQDFFRINIGYPLLENNPIDNQSLAQLDRLITLIKKQLER
jgi:DNA-binding transcriptional MocR family regulator